MAGHHPRVDVATRYRRYSTPERTAATAAMNHAMAVDSTTIATPVPWLPGGSPGEPLWCRGLAAGLDGCPRGHGQLAWGGEGEDDADHWHLFHLFSPSLETY